VASTSSEVVDLRATATIDVPQALATVHDRLPVGALVRVRFAADAGGSLVDDLVEGAGFVWRDRAARIVERARTLPDRVGPGLRVLVCGLNPSLYAADAGVGFARPGNRFWPAALASGLVTVDRDPRHALEVHRVGATDLVKRATARADEVDRAEFVRGAARVDRLCRLLEPRVLCVVGITGWRAAVDKSARTGWQPLAIGATAVYVMHNPSGLNAHATPAALAAALREVAERAG
jgi:TDG/mug DNA glycosylase family protein